MRDISRPCRCGSGEWREALHDARGIFLDYCCTACEQRVRAKYRIEVLEDPAYECDEPIEEPD
jgi:hypothetical protein